MIYGAFCTRSPTELLNYLTLCGCVRVTIFIGHSCVYPASIAEDIGGTKRGGVRQAGPEKNELFEPSVSLIGIKRSCCTS